MTRPCSLRASLLEQPGSARARAPAPLASLGRVKRGVQSADLVCLERRAKLGVRNVDNARASARRANDVDRYVVHERSDLRRFLPPLHVSDKRFGRYELVDVAVALRGVLEVAG